MRKLTVSNNNHNLPVVNLAALALVFAGQDNHFVIALDLQHFPTYSYLVC